MPEGENGSTQQPATPEGENGSAQQPATPEGENGSAQQPEISDGENGSGESSAKPDDANENSGSDKNRRGRKDGHRRGNSSPETTDASISDISVGDTIMIVTDSSGNASSVTIRELPDNTQDGSGTTGI